MQLSIVILTWNSENHIEICLNTLIRSLQRSNIQEYEIFIVDNGSKDHTRSIIKRFQSEHTDKIKVILLDINHGTTFSRNIALKQARGDFISMIDSDIIFSTDVFSPLITILVQDQTIGMAVPRLVYSNGNFQKSTDKFPTILRKVHRYFLLKQIESNYKKESCQDYQYVDYAISAFWLMKKEVIDKIGLLDERIFYAPEDVDYCLRIWKSGLRIIYVPSCEVIHNAQEISRGLRINRAFFEHIKGLLYLYIKHRYFFRAPRISTQK